MARTLACEVRPQPMTNAVEMYFLVGLAYWLCTLVLHGEPESLRRDPIALRARIHLVAAVLAVAGWPAAVAVDLRNLRR